MVLVNATMPPTTVTVFVVARLVVMQSVLMTQLQPVVTDNQSDADSHTSRHGDPTIFILNKY